MCIIRPPCLLVLSRESWHWYVYFFSINAVIINLTELKWTLFAALNLFLYNQSLSSTSITSLRIRLLVVLANVSPLSEITVCLCHNVVYNHFLFLCHVSLTAPITSLGSRLSPSITPRGLEPVSTNLSNDIFWFWPTPPAFGARRGWLRSNFAEIFGFRKLESLGYRVVLFVWSCV